VEFFTIYCKEIIIGIYVMLVFRWFLLDLKYAEIKISPKLLCR